MPKTNKEKVLAYLQSLSPQGATNSQIREATHVEPHQQVFMITRELMSRQLIRGRHDEPEWVFYSNSDPEAEEPLPEPLTETSKEFERFERQARQALSAQLWRHTP